jgi:hypothetical protein
MDFCCKFAKCYNGLSDFKFIRGVEMPKTKSKQYRVLVTLIVTLMVLLGGIVNAQVPQLINYQGRLVDSSGDPVADGQYLLNFKIYGSESGTDSLWSSGDQSVNVINGLFEYQLGSNNPIPLDFFGPGSEPFLSVTIGGDPELVPRTQIISSAFAFHANSAGMASIATIAEELSCTECVTTTEIADGTILFSDIGQNGANTDQVMKWNGSAWIPADDESESGGAGDITAVFAGNGLHGGGETGDVSLDIDSTYLDNLIDTSNARYADSAGFASSADTASYALETGHSIHSDTAGFSHQALVASEAGYAMTSDTANYAHNSPGIALPYDASISDPTTAFRIVNTGPSSGTAIEGRSEENDGVVGWTNVSGKSGVYGYNASGTGVSGRSEGEGIGVYGETSSTDTLHGGVKGINFGDYGAGVYGHGDAIGVLGVGTDDFNGTGVKGISHGNTGYGGYFASSSPNGTALFAASTGNGYAGSFNGHVYISHGSFFARSGGRGGWAGYFDADSLTDANSEVLYAEYKGPSPAYDTAVGIHSVCITEDSTGIGGYFEGGRTGIKAEVQPLGDSWYYGAVTYVDGSLNTGYSGMYHGVATAVHGNGNDSNHGFSAMVKDGRTNIGGSFYATKGSTGTGNFNYGVRATANVADSNNYGVYSEASFGDTCFGIYTVADNSNYNCGIYSTIGSGAGSAGIFNGDVSVIGDIYGLNKYFRIDHPLDPENKYLYHSSVESPDMKTVYDGVITLDNNGTAVVQLPDYFEALNKDFCYQLTCIGGWAQVYIDQEISDNRFTIAGGKPGMKVSWMVTGIRQDAYAENNRKQIEENKPESERGLYLNPEAFGLDNDKAIYKDRADTAPPGIDPDYIDKQ